ncbi:MAG: dTDP-4-dehydrorhamnose 3,5-epimerase family protein [Syntrophaceae bacterium]|nr:dTDP-4-dehydrorhamnose 3,5-epimerase family protein [Syntrophaceae bacterium]
MNIQKGSIEGVVITSIKKYSDERGWLAELFRHDELAQEYYPQMAYISMTNPGVLRGPHEHVDQADLFALVGPGDFKFTLWDNREGSLTYGNRMEYFMGANNPGSVLVPKGVVHCYRCISIVPGLVFNAPNQLYAGAKKEISVDEIRHEDDPENIYVKDEMSRRGQPQ